MRFVVGFWRILVLVPVICATVAWGLHENAADTTWIPILRVLGFVAAVLLETTALWWSVTARDHRARLDALGDALAGFFACLVMATTLWL